MAKDKPSFILYADMVHVVKKLVEQDRKNKTNHAGELFLHILEYVNDKDPVPVDFIVEMAFEPIKAQLKRDLVKYINKQEQWSKAGKASAEKRKKTKKKSTSVKVRSTDSTVNATVTVNDTVNVIDINTPAFSEVETYVQSKVDAEAFWKIKASLKLKYQSWIENGWRDGNDKPIVNWKTKILNTLPFLKKDENSWKDGHGVKTKESSDAMYDFMEAQRKA